MKTTEAFAMSSIYYMACEINVRLCRLKLEKICIDIQSRSNFDIALVWCLRANTIKLKHPNKPYLADQITQALSPK